MRRPTPDRPISGRPAPDRPGRVYQDERTRVVDAGPDDLWQVIIGLGGARGWYTSTPAWRVRGALDRLVGGPGLRRGRPDRLRAGDPLDFWRVEEVRDGALLRLRAEMRLPGTAWLELEVGSDAGRTLLRQRSFFRPRGLSGRLYRLLERPLHSLVFALMADDIAAAAQARQHTPSSPPDS